MYRNGAPPVDWLALVRAAHVLENRECRRSAGYGASGQHRVGTGTEWATWAGSIPHNIGAPVRALPDRDGPGSCHMAEPRMVTNVRS